MGHPRGHRDSNQGAGIPEPLLPATWLGRRAARPARGRARPPLQQELLSLIAEMDAFYRDVLNREQARGAQADPEELRQAQQVLAALEGYQGQITGLKPGDAGSASFRLPPSPA